MDLGASVDEEAAAVGCRICGADAERQPASDKTLG